MSKCSKCNDTGYYRKKIDGYDTVCECECLAEIKIKRELQRSGLKSLLDNNIKDFKVKYPHQKNMKQMAIEYVKSDSRDWFVMLGASGSGKTMLCSAVAKTLIKKGLKTRYVVWTSFTKELNALMFQGEKADARALDKYKQIPVLYIDDFLKGRSTEYNLTVAFDLLNYRVINKLPTIISSEFTMKELLNIDEAVAGRINESASGYVMEVPKGANTNYRMANNKIRIA